MATPMVNSAPNQPAERRRGRGGGGGVVGHAGTVGGAAAPVVSLTVPGAAGAVVPAVDSAHPVRRPLRAVRSGATDRWRVRTAAPAQEPGEDSDRDDDPPRPQAGIPV